MKNNAGIIYMLCLGGLMLWIGLNPKLDDYLADKFGFGVYSTGSGGGTTKTAQSNSNNAATGSGNVRPGLDITTSGSFRNEQQRIQKQAEAIMQQYGLGG